MAELPDLQNIKLQPFFTNQAFTVTSSPELLYALFEPMGI